MSQPAITVENISKRYQIHVGPQYRTLRDSIANAFSSPLRYFRERTASTAGNREDFWALKDVSFDIQPGEVVGIIGRNGAGKSTLLKVLSRITWPTDGRATIRGRVGSLLEVGTGFHPELTGRENIFLNGAILGMRKTEIVRNFDEIVAFAEIDKFLDTPVKHYSSGMYVRLAFAIAAHLNPEILIVDEVLAVGDMAFQQKCLGKISQVSRGGRTVIFVSHNLAAVENLCERGIVLHRAKLEFDGALSDAVSFYLNRVATVNDQQGHTFDLGGAKRVSKVGKLLKKIEFHTDDDIPLAGGLRLGTGVKIRVHFELPEPVSSYDLGLGFVDRYGKRVFTAHTLFEPNHPNDVRVGPQVFVCEIPSLTLFPGTYRIGVWVDINRDEADFVEDAAQITVLDADFYGTGRRPWNGSFVLPHHWYPQEASMPQTYQGDLMEINTPE